MEPDVSIETSCMIRIAVLPIGNVPPSLLRDYHSMLLPHHTIPLSTISSFYTEHQKSPFAHQPWDKGSLRFKFLLGGSPPSPWEDFQPNRKILCVIGICHCPSSPDLDVVIEQFNAACKSYSSALVLRCFAFCPGDSQLVDGDQGQKRRLARAQKTIGDYCLLAGSPVDANAHYTTALELARLTADYFWYAGALEGSVCAILIIFNGNKWIRLVDQMDKKDTSVEDEVRYRYNSVITHYRKSFIQDNVQRVSPITFELEATLKLARFLCRRELTKEVVELLTNAADGAKSLIDASDRLILYVEIARLFGTLGYQRKAAFFSRQVAQLYLQQENRHAATSAMQVLAMTTKAYRVQSRASSAYHSISNETGTGHADSGKLHHQSVVSLFESQWSTLQMVVLREILLSAVRAGDPLTAWSAAARLLRSYYPLITPAGQNGLASALKNAAERLPSGTRCADPALPFIRVYSFPLHPSQMDIVKRNPAREDWWAGSAPSGPFIYTPFSKGESSDNSKQDLVWIVGEPVQVFVELANPCGFDLKVDSIYLSVQSGNFDPFPLNVDLPPNSSQVIMLSGIPTSVGRVVIPGCTVHCFGVITEHHFKDVDNLLLGAAQGLVLSDPFRCCGSPRLRNVSVPNISVIPPLPLLMSRVVGGDGAIVLYEGEIRDVWITLANAGTIAVEQAHISLSGKNQDSVISIGFEKLKSALPLKPGAEVTIPLTLKAWQLGLGESDTAAGKSASVSMGRTVKDGSCPSLLIHYAGPLGEVGDLEKNKTSVPPGRRLAVPLQICVLQGLSFVKARLLSMEIPAHVSGSPSNLANVDGNPSDESVSCGSKIERLVKIDPFRGSWGLRFLELEMSNPTDVVFEISVFVLEKPSSEGNVSVDYAAEYGYPKTRIDREYFSRVLIPLEHFKLPFLDDSFFSKDMQSDGSTGGKDSSFSERNTKSELNASIKSLTSRIKVRWQSGRNSSGELNITDAIRAALQSSIMDILLPDPLTFGFRLARNGSENATKLDSPKESDTSSTSKNPVIAHDMTPMEVLVRNNTKETIKMSLSVTCRDVAGQNCVDGAKASVLWAGVLSGITMEVPPLQEGKHSFSLYFLVPGEYTMVAAAVIDDANDVLRARAKCESPDEPIFCRGPPFHVRVIGTA
ncbi:TRS120 protein [Hibiscus syriacus]|uniref:TRS120 protein n=1 Tax=Hibiscus syriacus TaxID=106335 RepID=A0A6A2WHN2_HIBSY|nr:TRS120 protein [Hibiscus syriacus]